MAVIIHATNCCLICIIVDVDDVIQVDDMAVFRASDNVQSGDVACVTLSIVEDDILEPMVEFLVLFQISPLVNEPQDSPDFTRVLVIDTTAQGQHSLTLPAVKSGPEMIIIIISWFDRCCTGL